MTRNIQQSESVPTIRDCYQHMVRDRDTPRLLALAFAPIVQYLAAELAADSAFKYRHQPPLKDR